MYGIEKRFAVKSTRLRRSKLLVVSNRQPAIDDGLIGLCGRPPLVYALVLTGGRRAENRELLFVVKGVTHGDGTI